MDKSFSPLRRIPKKATKMRLVQLYFSFRIKDANIIDVKFMRFQSFHTKPGIIATSR